MTGSVPPAPRTGVPPGTEELFGSQFPAAERYVELLGTKGVVRGLIGPREVDRLWDRHIVNSAVVCEVLPRGADVVDVGSGAGLPGIPLALVRPDLRVTLLEPMQRRCTFLDEVVEELGLASRVRVVRGRAPDAARGPKGLTFDIAVARAVAPLDRLGALMSPILRPAGLMAALRGSKVDEELATVRGDLEAQGWRDVEVVTCGAGWLDQPTRVLRAVRGIARAGSGSGGRHGGNQKQNGRTARDARRGREASRDQRARGQARST
jgi:16S rRNA (guanine527-N7)-methyltransferase